MKLSKELKTIFGQNGYENICHFDNIGWCGLQKFTFSYAIMCGLSKYTYKYRYCYPTEIEATIALNDWDGKGHPPGGWVKRKGADGDLINPKL